MKQSRGLGSFSKSLSNKQLLIGTHQWYQNISPEQEIQFETLSSPSFHDKLVAYHRRFDIIMMCGWRVIAIYVERILCQNTQCVM